MIYPQFQTLDLREHQSPLASLIEECPGENTKPSRQHRCALPLDSVLCVHQSPFWLHWFLHTALGLSVVSIKPPSACTSTALGLSEVTIKNIVEYILLNRTPHNWVPAIAGAVVSPDENRADAMNMLAASISPPDMVL